eukprot:1392916-Rhodomonas_salina.1
MTLSSILLRISPSFSLALISLARLDPTPLSLLPLFLLIFPSPQLLLCLFRCAYPPFTLPLLARFPPLFRGVSRAVSHVKDVSVAQTTSPARVTSIPGVNVDFRTDIQVTGCGVIWPDQSGCEAKGIMIHRCLCRARLL